MLIRKTISDANNAKVKQKSLKPLENSSFRSFFSSIFLHHTSEVGWEKLFIIGFSRYIPKIVEISAV